MIVMTAAINDSLTAKTRPENEACTTSLCDCVYTTLPPNTGFQQPPPHRYNPAVGWNCRSYRKGLVPGGTSLVSSGRESPLSAMPWRTWHPYLPYTWLVRQRLKICGSNYKIKEVLASSYGRIERPVSCKRQRNLTGALSFWLTEFF